MTRVGIISQARMTSSRLPGKVLIEAGGASMLAHHIRRLKTSGYPVFIATTTNTTDDPIVAAATAEGVGVFRGSENDVLGRFDATAREFGLDVVVRVTSDCPLIDGALVQHGIERFFELANDDAYVSNTLERSYPRGYDFEVFSANALREAATHATLQSDREHVTPYLNQNRSGRVTLGSIRRDENASELRITLDTEEDLTLLATLFNDHDAANLDGDSIVEVLLGRPELAAINSHIEQKKLGQ